MASVRFICGTQELHKQLEPRSREFLGTEDTILYSSCFDANGGLFETLLGARGRRHLRRAEPRLDHRRHPAVQGPAVPLPQQRHGRPGGASCRKPQTARFRLIATDGVFSMDGTIANLPAICELADRYDALVMVDDSHAVGFLGPQRPRHARVSRRDGPGRHPHRHAGQGPGRRQRRLHQRPARDRRNCCGSGRGPTCSPTRCRRRSWRPR